MTNTILQRQTRVRREIARRFQSDLFNASQLRERVMRETRGHIKATEGSTAFGTPRIPARSITWSMTAKAKPHKPSEFESVLLAIAGHDLRQPIQVLQNAREFLGRGVRTRSELRLLRLVQSAIDRLRDQLDELVAALQLRGGARGMKLTSVLVGPLLQASCLRERSCSSDEGIQGSYGPDWRYD
jgi:two-component system phosphate regulon sensor histidine kinase PhoR